jgi:hypothetical protein
MEADRFTNVPFLAESSAVGLGVRRQHCQAELKVNQFFTKYVRRNQQSFQKCFVIPSELLSISQSSQRETTCGVNAEHHFR